MFFLTHFHITHPNPTSSPSAMGTRWQAGGLRRSGHSRGHRQAPSMVRRGGCAEGWGRGRGRPRLVAFPLRGQRARPG
jgi:hypothetical protein